MYNRKSIAPRTESGGLPVLTGVHIRTTFCYIFQLHCSRIKSF